MMIPIPPTTEKSEVRDIFSVISPLDEPAFQQRNQNEYFNIPRAKKPDKTGIKKPIPNETFAIREGDQLKEVSIEEYETTMNDFSQRFLVAAWDENENFVFSPFSLHSVLAMLTTGVTDNSITQLELLQAFGKSQNIQNIEKNYRNLAEQYNNSSIEKILSFGNRLWTTRKYFN